MSDEIKEILREAKEYRYIDLNTEKTDLLLDYITNLQEENMKLITQLEDRAYEQIKFQWKDYKSRCEKAIEYIKPKFIAQGGLTSYEINDLLNDLLNILQGEDTNVKNKR